MSVATGAPDPVRIDVHLRDGTLASLADDVRTGLSRYPRELPPKYFYDARGSELFERITELPEYYPSQVEQDILDAAGARIVDLVRPQEIVELGPGSARKTTALLKPMVGLGIDARYIPVDVSETAVQDCAERLVSRYESLAVHGVVGDFERHLDRIPRPSGRRLIAFLGGTIGNLDHPRRARLLQALRAQLGPGDRLLVGTDLVKDRERLEAAYNDSAGVTAEFNRNMLRVINAHLDGDLDPDMFDHVAFYNEHARRIEMWLRARTDMTVRIAALEMDVDFEAGEEMRTEISCKFTPESVASMYAAAGLRLEEWHEDGRGWFAVSLATLA
jgi:L-histidine Nalpha-methyltransferase